LPACGLDVNGKGDGKADNISLFRTNVLSALPRVPAIYGKTTAKEDKMIVGAQGGGPPKKMTLGAVSWPIGKNPLHLGGIVIEILEPKGIRLDETNISTKGDSTVVRKANLAFMKPLKPSAALGQVVGDKPLPRTEVVKKLWQYIKKNDLQDKKNRRNINADAKLKPIFGKPQVSMFEMTKLISKHLS